MFRSRARRSVVRLFAGCSPTAMAATVIVRANHYVIDGPLGAVVALAGFALSSWLTPKISFYGARGNGGSPVRSNGAAASTVGPERSSPSLPAPRLFSANVQLGVLDWRDGPATDREPDGNRGRAE
jgi:hypothetical protein